MKNAGALVATLALIGAADSTASSAAGVSATAPAYVSPLQKAATPTDIATGPSGAQAVLWDSYYREPSSVLGVRVQAGIARRSGPQEPWAAEILDPAALGAKDVTVGPDGTTTAAWISRQPRAEGTRAAERSELRVAQAPSGGAFGPAHSLGDGSKTRILHIAALRDGRTVVVWLRRDVRAGAASAAVHSPATGWTAPQPLPPSVSARRSPAGLRGCRFSQAPRGAPL